MITLKQVSNKGAAMPLAVLVGALLLVVSVSLLSLGRHFRLQALQNNDAIAAQVAADAGLTKAVYDMQQKLDNKLWDNSNLPGEKSVLPNCDAGYDYQVTGDIVNGFIVESTGQSRGIQKNVSAELTLAGLFDYSLFSKGSISFKNGSAVDEINTPPGGSVLKVGTNTTAAGGITLNNSVVINGDVQVGAGGDPATVITMKSGATITGTKSTLLAPWIPPDVVVPTGLAAMASQGSISSNTTITTSGKYDSINLGNGKILKIDGDVELYITGSITLGNSAEVQVLSTDPDASLTIYMGGSLEEKNSAKFNNLTQDAKKLTLCGLDTCTQMAFKNGGDYYGTIYAPDADIVVHNSMEIFGAVVANSYEQKAKSDFHYDASLKEVDTDDLGARFKVIRWQEE
jgi:hypothetical protein